MASTFAPTAYVAQDGSKSSRLLPLPYCPCLLPFLCTHTSPPPHPELVLYPCFALALLCLTCWPARFSPALPSVPPPAVTMCTPFLLLNPPVGSWLLLLFSALPLCCSRITFQADSSATVSGLLPWSCPPGEQYPLSALGPWRQPANPFPLELHCWHGGSVRVRDAPPASGLSPPISCSLSV